jgi:hypothetical protein
VYFSSSLIHYFKSLTAIVPTGKSRYAKQNKEEGSPFVTVVPAEVFIVNLLEHGCLCMNLSGPTHKMHANYAAPE